MSITAATGIEWLALCYTQYPIYMLFTFNLYTCSVRDPQVNDMHAMVLLLARMLLPLLRTLQDQNTNSMHHVQIWFVLCLWGIRVIPILMQGVLASVLAIVWYSIRIEDWKFKGLLWWLS